MKLVYRHPDGQPYGGIDVGVGGDRYKVIKEGSRQIIRGVPNTLVPLLEPHYWYATGVVNADVVEDAAQEALKAKAADDEAAKKAAEEAEAKRKEEEAKAAAAAKKK